MIKLKSILIEVVDEKERLTEQDKANDIIMGILNKIEKSDPKGYQQIIGYFKQGKIDQLLNHPQIKNQGINIAKKLQVGPQNELKKTASLSQRIGQAVANKRPDSNLKKVEDWMDKNPKISAATGVPLILATMFTAGLGSGKVGVEFIKAMQRKLAKKLRSIPNSKDFKGAPTPEQLAAYDKKAEFRKKQRDARLQKVKDIDPKVPYLVTMDPEPKPTTPTPEPSPAPAPAPSPEPAPAPAPAPKEKITAAEVEELKNNLNTTKFQRTAELNIRAKELTSKDGVPQDLLDKWQQIKPPRTALESIIKFNLKTI